MTKRMLIDATHAEETRVVVLDGNRLEDFDVETSTKRQLKGNIYLAKVVRVEPSLQAAFVEYGGNRHGFLAFGEIHPDYYQIPVADRQRLIAQQLEEAQREQEEEEREAEAGAGAEARAAAEPAPEPEAQPLLITDSGLRGPAEEMAATTETAAAAMAAEPAPEAGIELAGAAETPAETELAPVSEPAAFEIAGLPDETEAAVTEAAEAPEQEVEEAEETEEPIPEAPPPEIIGGEHDTGEEQRERRIPPRFLRNYKIQEVIKRRQILLVQVVKEERGTKGAALTTYISLAGRYCVLMPNSPRGGGVSRKITAATDRRRLKDVISELALPPGMGIIVRTAGANRPKPEIKRDCEYLLRLWDDIREHTLRSVAPALIYEEASLIKRAIRDVYSRDIEEIVVDGEDGWRAARDFMRMLMPSHARKVQLWRDGAGAAGMPLFSRYQVDAQLDAVLSPTVQLRSGGYLVINQAEALVAIDVNSGRSTRERGIEETALRTNLEAADEVGRQLRLRDLAGLIVIDFIDMEARKHNAMVERRLKEALKADRARIQVGHISHFGLLEMSRQRLRPSLAETSFVLCPHCGGTGHVRSTESAALHVLRAVEEEGAKQRAAEIVVHIAPAIGMYIFNHKRDRLREIESRCNIRVMFSADETLISPQFRIERLRAQVPAELHAAVTPEAGRTALPPPAETVTEERPEEEPVAEEAAAEGAEETAGAEAAETAEEAERRRRRRRRRRRGGRREEPGLPTEAAEAEAGEAAGGEEVEPEIAAAETHIEGVPEYAEPAVAEAAPEAAPEAEPEAADEEARGRRRGRRGGRRRRREPGEVLPSVAQPGAEQPELPPVYAGPTPANPFGGHTFDIFDVLEQAEERAAAPGAPRVAIIEGPPPETSAPVPAEAAEAAVTAPEPTPISEPAAAPTPTEPETVAETVADIEMGTAPAPEPAVPEAIAETVARIEMGEPGAVEAEPAPLRAAEIPGGEGAAPQPRPAAAEPPVEAAASPEPANDLAAEPAVRPIVIGAEAEPPAEKKRGWWRR